MTTNSTLTPTRVLRVLVADDSALVQDFLCSLLDDEPDMLVVGRAKNGQEVLDLVKTLRPDLITMDVNMPRLDGVEAARRIMAECPTPIAVVTAAPVGPGSDVAFNAMAAGAVDVLAKPRRQEFEEQPAKRAEFVRQLRNTAYVPVVGIRRRAEAASAARPLPEPRSTAIAPEPSALNRPEVIAIGASTGGPPAIRTALSRLDPQACPPVLLVQHMSAEFMPGFASWLDGVVPPKVMLAESGTPLRPGHVYVAAGDRHLIVSHGRLGLTQGPAVQFQRPSADVLFHSVAAEFGSRAIGVLLTGMGRDGADGLLAMYRAGAMTVTQDEATSLVYGMPRAAAELGASRLSATPEYVAQVLRQLPTAMVRTGGRSA